MEELDDILLHYGVKGMKWGVIRAKAQSIKKSRAEKVLAKKDAKWKKEVFQNGTRHFAKANNDSIPEINEFIKKLNKKYEGVDVREGKNRDKYENEYWKKNTEVLNKHLNKVKSPSGKLRLAYDDSKGTIVEEVKQSAINDLDDILQHYGVKGMKWGVIRSKASSVGKSVKSATKSTAKAVKTRMEEEAKSSKRETSWKKKLSTIHDMDNKELQSTLNRVRLENDFKRLAKDQKTRNSADRKNRRDDLKTYRNREKLSDSQLASTVEKLRLKDGLRRQISNATKEHRESGKKLVDQVGDLNPKLKPFVDVGKQLVDKAYGAY